MTSLRGWATLALLYPIAEIFTILAVSDRFGAAPTFLVLVAQAIIGVMVIQSAGRSAFAQLRRQANRGIVVDPRGLGDAARTGLVGVLLIVPGFISDGVALWLALSGGRTDVARRSNPPPGTIDLGQADYTRIDDKQK